MKKNIFYLFQVFVFASTLLFTKVSAQTLSVTTSTNTSSLIEGGTFSFTINLSSVSSTPVVVDITTNSGTADSSDYTPLTTTVTIPAGQLVSTNSLTIATTNDSNPETLEIFTLVATVTSGNTTNTTYSKVLEIIDNDTLPRITFSNASQGIIYVNESNSHTIELKLSNPYNTAVSINFSTSNGSATTSDYSPVNTTLTIPAGQTTISQSIVIINDAIAEGDEMFHLSAVVSSGNTYNTGVSTVLVIKDNDTTPKLSIYCDLAYEGSQAFISARLDRIYNTDVVFQFSTSNGTANSSDYTSTVVTKTIPSGTMATSIVIPILDDTIDELMETFTCMATVTSGNTTNTSDSKIQKIVDNDGLPDFYIKHFADQGFTDGFVKEGKVVNWGIILTSPSSTDTVIQVTTTSGNAGTSDYSAINTTITVPAGLSNYGLFSSPIATLLDALQEGDETFTITGTLISGNTINTTSDTQITILDNYGIDTKNDGITAPFMVGGTYNILANDTLNGLPLNPNDVTISLGNNDIDATLDTQGNLTFTSSTPYGYHSLFYFASEIANPNNYAVGFIIIYITSPLQINHTISYSDYNADGFVSVGDIINYTFTVTNNGNAPVSNIAFNGSIYGLTTNGGPITTLNPGQTDNTTFTGYHVINQEDINFGFNTLNEISFIGTYYGNNYYSFSEEIGTFSVPLPDGIKLNAFVDANANGTQEPNEVNFPLGQFNYEMNNDGVIHNLYNNPFFMNESNPNTTYSLSYTINSQYAANSSCSVTYPSVTVATGSGVTTYNFPITVTPYNDLSVTIHNYNNPPSPGFGYENYIIYKNNSNQNVSSGTINYTKDSALSIIDLSNGATITPTGFTYNFTNLLPYETRYVWVRLQVPTLPTVALDQLVTNSATITTLPGDILPLNNSSSLTQTIVGAYDPNDKQESHGGRILHSAFTSNDYLTYTIRFENTGTANAINVKVEDELDAQLDETSLKMVAASADYSLERVNRSLVWKFNGIDLPPSVPDTQIGHGYITFQIKPKAGYAIGDIIPNTAEIYFDFNPAIVTNTCNTVFVATLGSENFVFSNLNYFPNPMKNSLTISNTSLIDSVEITSVLGQNMLSQKVNSLQTDIDISAFSNGIYFVKITSERQEKTVKIVKE